MPASAPPACRVPAALAAAAALALAAAPAAADPPPAAPAGGPGAPETPPVPTFQPPADPVTAELGVRLGGAFRVGDSASFGIDSRTGAVVGVGLAVAPSPRFSIGLAYEHAGLGTEHSAGDLGIADVGRTLDSLWATVRLNFLHVDRFAFSLSLGPGLVWQSVDADVILLGGGEVQPDPFRCSETAGPGLGLRAGVGVEAALGGGFFFQLDGTIDELRLSSDTLGTCAPGAGSTAQASVRGGFAYRFDVSRYVR